MTELRLELEQIAIDRTGEPNELVLERYVFFVGPALPAPLAKPSLIIQAHPLLCS
jgi:hypothetical protein